MALTLRQNHHPVSPEAGMTVTKRSNPIRGKINAGRPPVSDKEVIARPVVLVESHNYLSKSSSSTDASVLPSRYLTMTGV